VVGLVFISLYVHYYQIENNDLVWLTKDVFPYQRDFWLRNMLLLSEVGSYMVNKKKDNSTQ